MTCLKKIYNIYSLTIRGLSAYDKSKCVSEPTEKKYVYVNIDTISLFYVQLVEINIINMYDEHLDIFIFTFP
jgi:hypothetical protein